MGGEAILTGLGAPGNNRRGLRSRIGGGTPETGRGGTAPAIPPPRLFGEEGASYFPLACIFWASPVANFSYITLSTAKVPNM